MQGRRDARPTSLPLKRELRARASALAVGFLAARRLLRLVGQHPTRPSTCAPPQRVFHGRRHQMVRPNVSATELRAALRGASLGVGSSRFVRSWGQLAGILRPHLGKEAHDGLGRLARPSLQQEMRTVDHLGRELRDLAGALRQTAGAHEPICSAAEVEHRHRNGRQQRPNVYVEDLSQAIHKHLSPHRGGRTSHLADKV